MLELNFTNFFQEISSYFFISLKKFFIFLILYLESEADEAENNFSENLESWIRQNQSLEFVSLSNMLSYEVLQFFYAINAKDEPKFQGAESASQWNLPMLKLRI